jgi:drug/metabolite transporter (DMT)-like permease
VLGMSPNGRKLFYSGVGLLTTSGGDPNLGDAYCILSALLFGVHVWRSESISCAISDTAALCALQLAVLAGASLVLAIPEMTDFLGSVGISAAVAAATHLPWLEILFMAFGTTALTLYIEMDSLKEVSAPLAALIYTTEPLWGAAFAWMLLNERWGTQGWIGAALIVAASLASQLGGDTTEHAPRELS